MFKFIWRYGYRFATSRQYRSYIFQLLREKSSTSAAQGSFVLSENNDFTNLSGTRAFLSGGCELDFVGDCLQAAGLKVYHTVANGRTAEPIAEVMDPSSMLFAQQWDLVMFCQTQSFMQILAKMFSAGGAYSEEERQKDFNDLVARLRSAVECVDKKLGCPVFLVSHFFIHGKYRGVHEYKSALGMTSYEEMNLKYTVALYEMAKRFKNVYVLDVNRILEVEGKKAALQYDGRGGIFDHPTKVGARLISDEALYQFQVLNPRNKRIKCAVFDLDNTLWRGVLREDGAGNLDLEHGRVAVMRALISRGILLAVVSKNDPQEVEFVKEVLGAELFDQLVCVKLNWNAKSMNIKQIARELNIGIDSIAFFDDNPVEREEVRTNAPGVTVFEETKVIDALDMVIFEPIGAVTEESASRTQMYKEQAQRAQAEASVEPADLTGFFKSCNFKLEIVRPSIGAAGRVEELIQRTNQLNATGNRTTRAELLRFLDNADDFYVSTASLKDKFGDYGLIGVCIARRAGDTWEVIEFDFSCRAMGKQVERAVLTHLCQAVRGVGAKHVAIRFKKTSRNAEMRSILVDFGFTAVDETDEALTLSFALEGRGELAYPEWFEMKSL